MCIFPHGVLNIVSNELSLSIHTIHNPDLAPIKVKYLDPYTSALRLPVVLV